MLTTTEINGTVDQIGAEERVKRLFSRSIKRESKVNALHLALSMLDLTTLEGKDSPGKVRQLCYKAAHLHDCYPDIPQVAAVCVYPNLVRVAKESLFGTSIKVASVATGFPSGMSSMNEKLAEVRKVVKDGACESAHLKVILETGELETLDNVRRASILAMESGADFIKTSTGKISPAATPVVVLTMLEAIRDYFNKTGRRVGMKPAGGISKAKQGVQYLVMLKETLGTSWLTSDLFRFGASSLANDVLMQIVKQSDGVYQSLDYFSLD